jgi:hypothetical protein
VRASQLARAPETVCTWFAHRFSDQRESVLMEQVDFDHLFRDLRFHGWTQVLE